MNIENELNRLELLFLVLRYCSEKGRFFTIGERICINQERALLIQEEYDIENHNYQQPQTICNKIDFIVRKINETGYTPQTDFYE
ncbi:hypothetical protein [Flavobacterium covae]|uniref:hypothetical protein n=1 Tax=Flavobacterium covae TaxID=2906076 RepID=UPI000745E1A1|nr:hypothetical protein [Flavobacterium covae]AMA48094.1 hypothetical protein AWN65_00765 [Flavobacterium covae]MCJ1808893.1 hypothetical protein [Flavobacterium covae]